MPKNTKPMTQTEILAALAERNGITKKDAAQFLDSLVVLATKEMNNGFKIPGLGKLEKKHRAARMGRNPATGEAIKIAAKTVVKFRVAKSLKDAIK